MNRPDNTLPDEHLRQALRHAPDHDRRVPALLSASILSAARRAAGEVPQRRRFGLGGWRGLPWQGVGTLAAVLMVSAVLWVQRDALQPAVLPSEPAGAPAEASPGQVVEALPRARTLAEDSRTAAPAQRARTPGAAAPAAVQATRSKAPGPAPASAGLAGGEPPATGPSRVQAAESADAAIAAAPAPTAEARSEPGLTRSRTLHRESLQAARESVADGTQSPVAAAAPTAAAPAPAKAAGASLRIALAEAPWDDGGFDGWTPNGTDTSPRPLPAGWMQALMAATPSWSDARAQDLTASSPREITLWKGGSAQGRLRLSRSHAIWCASDRGCRVATADPAVLAELLSTLPP